MTIVAVWKDKQDALWIAADTRISSVGSGGGVIVKSDSAAKMVGMNVSCTTEEGWLSPARPYRTTIGFAFAGAALPALLTAVTASSLLSDLYPLIRNQPPTPPSLFDLADAVGQIGTKFTREYYSALPTSASLFEAIVVGHCATLNTPRAVRLSPIFSDAGSVSLSSQECDLSTVTAIGTGRETFFKRLDELERRDPGGMLGRFPMKVVGLMADDGVGDVGGSLSLGIVSGRSFYPYSKMYPSAGGQVTMRFNGIDLYSDLDLVGQRYGIGIRGMT